MVVICVVAQLNANLGKPASQQFGQRVRDRDLACSEQPIAIDAKIGPKPRDQLLENGEISYFVHFPEPLRDELLGPRSGHVLT